MEEKIKIEVFNSNRYCYGEEGYCSLWRITFPPSVYEENEVFSIVMVGRIIRKKLPKDKINNMVRKLFNGYMNIFINFVNTESYYNINDIDSLIFTGELGIEVLEIDRVTENPFQFPHNPKVEKLLWKLICNLKKIK